MFKPSAAFKVYGEVLGFDVTIQIEVRGQSADASPLPGLGAGPMIVDAQNIQTMLISAINGQLAKLQHMDSHIDGSSIADLRSGRAFQTTVPKEPDISLVNMKDFKDGKTH